MKNIVLILMTVSLFNCTSDNSSPKVMNTALLGKWKLMAQLVDPGDGSGVFNSVTSDRVVEFFNNGTVTANGELCYMSIEVGNNHSGTFMEVSGSTFSDGEITPNDCSNPQTKVFYKIEDENLILWYQCIEGCGQKFKKL
jgi:hypothetical protein